MAFNQNMHCVYTLSACIGDRESEWHIIKSRHVEKRPKTDNTDQITEINGSQMAFVMHFIEDNTW